MTISGCGAPTKTAGDVSYLFDTKAPSLQEKATSICDEIDGRTEEPNLEDIDLKLSNCSKSGAIALDYNKIDSFYFQGSDDAAVKASDEGEEMNFDLRTQVWLNKSLLGFATKVLNTIESGNFGTNNFTEMNPEGNQMTDLVKPKITKIGKSEFDMKEKTFSIDLNLKIDGIVEVDNDLAIRGALLGGGNKIAATIKTIKNPKQKTSFIKELDGLLLIIPHANDVYLDFFINVNLYNVGVESLMKDRINSAFGSAIKSAIDKLMAL